MLHPFQCLAYCFRPDAASNEILVAASGAYIHTFNVKKGNRLSTWPGTREDHTFLPTNTDQKPEGKPSLASGDDNDSSTRPLKRRKLSSAREDSGSSAEIVVEHESQNAESSSSAQPLNAPIIKLLSDNSGQYVIAVTGEDKAIRVFELSTDGVLNPFSER